MKKCGHCRQIFNIVNFGKHSYTKSGLRNWCKQCEKQYHDKNINNTRIWRKKNKDILYEKAKKYWIKNKDRFIYIKNAYRLKLKTECFNAYGGCLCKCCGEKELAFLSIDHINNDGAKERKKLKTVGGGANFYRYLKRHNYPDKHRYQVLCMNCQTGKKNNKGICPHQQK